MYHYVARALPGTLLFRTWAEGLRLLEMVRRAFPKLQAVCLMPDHLHLLLPRADGLARLRAVMSGFARWRQASRGRGGACAWAPAPEPELVLAEKENRNLRYVHLNPCRKGLVGDPLAWPLSSHRDAVGLAADPLVERHPRPRWFHRYVSADPTVAVEGTHLAAPHVGEVDVFAVQAAVSAVTRTVIGEALPPPVLRLFVRTAATYGVLDQLGATALGELLGVTRQWVTRLARGSPARHAIITDPALAACVRAVGDPRFEALRPGPLLGSPGWQPYRGRT